MSKATINPPKVEVKGNELVITMTLEKATPSTSLKNMVVASTHGNIVTEAKVDGKLITIGVNAYYRA